MCGCEKHHNDSRPCTCICPEHRNFERAYELAMQRYDQIRELEERVHRFAARIAELTTSDEQAVLAVARARALIPKWREERAAYPLDDPRGSIAFAAVKLCGEELEAALGEEVRRG